MTKTPDNDLHTDRILAVAIELAEADGYEAVRLRDVAARAEVAMGTVYRRFKGKEDLVAAVLAKLVGHFEDAVRVAPVPGETAEERVRVFLELATQALAERPKLASAMLRIIASGDPVVAGRIHAYKDTMTRILVMLVRGSNEHVVPSPREERVLGYVQNVWFAEMVGWTGGLQTADEALDHIHEATGILLAAMETP
jgi:AcrR family transcriptional regulator